jgi:hypothetical protein
VRPRRQGPALLCGPSTSPLDGMFSVTATQMRSTLFLATLLLTSQAAFAQASAPAERPDLSMFLENATGPFVSSDFARSLGRLVLEQKYARVKFDFLSPAILDKGDVWWVTFPVREWPEDMAKLAPVLPDHLTLWIRKRDAAILGIH